MAPQPSVLTTWPKAHPCGWVGTGGSVLADLPGPQGARAALAVLGAPEGPVGRELEMQGPGQSPPGLPCPGSH